MFWIHPYLVVGNSARDVHSGHNVHYDNQQDSGHGMYRPHEQKQQLPPDPPTGRTPAMSLPDFKLLSGEYVRDIVTAGTTTSLWITSANFLVSRRVSLSACSISGGRAMRV
jgi:hypothetical protein